MNFWQMAHIHFWTYHFSARDAITIFIKSNEFHCPCNTLVCEVILSMLTNNMRQHVHWPEMNEDGNNIALWYIRVTQLQNYEKGIGTNKLLSI